MARLAHAALIEAGAAAVTVESPEKTEKATKPAAKAKKDEAKPAADAKKSESASREPGQAG